MPTECSKNRSNLRPMHDTKSVLTKSHTEYGRQSVRNSTMCLWQQFYLTSVPSFNSSMFDFIKAKKSFTCFGSNFGSVFESIQA